jgi:3',5'-cyclic-AMP phosphodiesterase
MWSNPTPVRTILHLSDTHILPNENDQLHGVDSFQNVRDIFQRVAESGIHIDAVILSGDLADGGQLASYQRLRPELDRWRDQLQTRVIVAMGNHDARQTFRAGLLDAEASDEPIEYVTWLEGLRVVVLDSTVPGAPYGAVRPEQLDWLRAELATPAPEGTILVIHHPPVPDPSPMAGLLTLHGAPELEALVRDSDVVAILAGHAHHAITAAFGGAFCYAAPASAYTVDALLLGELILRGIHGPAFGLVRVFDRRAVALTVSMPSSGAETYRYPLTEDTLRRWSGDEAAAEAEVAAATPT